MKSESFTIILPPYKRVTDVMEYKLEMDQDTPQYTAYHCSHLKKSKCFDFEKCPVIVEDSQIMDECRAERE